MISFKPFFWASVFTALGVLALVSLGRWQLDRLAWKTDLIAAAEANAYGPALPLKSVLEAGTNLEYARIRVRGVFDHSRELYLFSQLEDQRIGFQVITPLTLTGGGTILVDRGFVPSSLKVPHERAAGLLEGEVEITGLIRQSQPPGLFTPPPDLANRVFYVRDAKAMSKLIDEGPLFAEILLAADKTPNPGGWPEGGHTRLTFKNDHLGYALTWFCLAVTLIGVYLAYHHQAGRLKIGPR